MMRLPTLHLPWKPTRQAVAPDAEALAQLCYSDIYRYALRRTGHIQDAEDVAADTFVASLEALPGFKGDIDPRLWLLGIARRKLADHVRKRYRRPERSLSCSMLQEVPDGAAGPEGAVLSIEARDTMRRLVLSLPDAQCEALLLQAAERLSVAEIAVVMRRSSSAVNSLLGRARATLRERGTPYFGDTDE